MSDITAPLAFELVRRAPSQRMAGLIWGMTGYRETASGRFSQRETAPMVVPLIISFGTPFLIALGREPDDADRQPSFAAGLHAGPVYIESDGRAECVQVDFTPLGAYRFFGGPGRGNVGNNPPNGALIYYQLKTALKKDEPKPDTTSAAKSEAVNCPPWSGAGP